MTRCRDMCRVEGCSKPSGKYGMCQHHRSRVRVTDLDEYFLNPDETKFNWCTGPECTKQSVARGLCISHYKQVARGNALKPLQLKKPKGQPAKPCFRETCKRPGTYSGLCSRHNQMATQYGMTYEEAKVLWAEEKCANPGCKNTEKLHTDHCHSTGRVRGMLCGNCNTALGFLDEDEGRISGLVEYLQNNLKTRG